MKRKKRSGFSCYCLSDVGTVVVSLYYVFFLTVCLLWYCSYSEGIVTQFSLCSYYTMLDGTVFIIYTIIVLCYNSI